MLEVSLSERNRASPLEGMVVPPPEEECILLASARFSASIPPRPLSRSFTLYPTWFEADRDTNSNRFDFLREGFRLFKPSSSLEPMQSLGIDKVLPWMTLNEAGRVWDSTGQSLTNECAQFDIYEPSAMYALPDTSFALPSNIKMATLPDPIGRSLNDFAAGLEGMRPTDAVVGMARRIARAAVDKTEEPEITVDVDGALSFDIRLINGWLVLAELDLHGSIDASIYDRFGTHVKRLLRATAEDLISIFSTDEHAS